MWLKRIRGALGMGLTWAIGGALVGGVIEFIANFVPGLNVVDMWIQLLAIPGFVSGAVFSVVLGIAGRRRKFEELSLGQFAVWGALSGALLGVLGLVWIFGAVVPLQAAVVIAAPALLSSVLASGTLALARMGERPQLDAGAKTPEP